MEITANVFTLRNPNLLTIIIINVRISFRKISSHINLALQASSWLYAIDNKFAANDTMHTPIFLQSSQSECVVHGLLHTWTCLDWIRLSFLQLGEKRMRFTPSVTSISCQLTGKVSYWLTKAPGERA